MRVLHGRRVRTMSGHDHGHASADRTRLLVALGITLAVLAMEVVGAVATGSLALLVDAAHVLTDAVGLVVAAIAATLVRRAASSRRTWGWRRAEVIAAAAQAAVLLVVGAYAVVEGVSRLVHPPAVSSGSLAVLGVVGLVANVACLFVLAGGRDADLTMRAAFLDVASDALGSVAVLVAGLVISWTGWTRADALAGLLVAALIVPRAAVLLRESGAILLESTPDGLDLDVVRDHIAERAHVRDVHDLHASTVATGLPTLTCHVVLDDECFTDGHSQRILLDLQDCVATHHGVSVEHATFQLENAAVAAAHRAHLHA